jgi:hypothetical protein
MTAGNATKLTMARFFKPYVHGMLKNFFEKLNHPFYNLDFVLGNRHRVRDSWGQFRPRGEIELPISVNGKYGWPDLEWYSREACLAEIQQVKHVDC